MRLISQTPQRSQAVAAFQPMYVKCHSHMRLCSCKPAPLRPVPFQRRRRRVIGAVQARLGPPEDSESPLQQEAYVGSVSIPEYPVTPPPQRQLQAAGSGGGGILGPVLWMVAGVAVYKVLEFGARLFKGGPGKVRENGQAMLMQKMMEQMMKSGGMPGGMPGASPFGGTGENPFPMGQNPFVGGQNPFAGAGSPFGTPGSTSQPTNPFAGFPAYDTTATPSSPTASPTSPEQQQQQQQQQQQSPQQQQQPGQQKPKQQARSTQPSAAKQSSTASSATAAPTPSPAPASAQPPPRPKTSAFVDVEDQDANPATARPPIIQAESSPSFGVPPSTATGFPPFGDASASTPLKNAADSTQDGGTANSMKQHQVKMLERLMTDESLQKLLYPYLPEPMRNKETFQWMLNNPEYRAQLEAILSQQSSPEMDALLNDFDYDNPAFQEQLATIGMTPEMVMQKIMADPELGPMFVKPEVQQAIIDVSKNQMNISKYSNNPEIMSVFNRLSNVFAKQPGP